MAAVVVAAVVVTAGLVGEAVIVRCSAMASGRVRRGDDGRRFVVADVSPDHDTSYMADHLTSDALEALREGSEFEAKAAQGRDGKGEVPDAIWASYVAMANTDGGTILLGAKEEKNGSLTPLGIQDIARVQKQFWDLVRNPQKVSADILNNEDVREVTADGCADPLLLITVPAAPRHKKPLYVGTNYKTGVYRRGYEGDYLITDEEELRRMFAESRQETRDGRVLTRMRLSDLDSDSIERYRALVREAKSRPGDERDLTSFLRMVGAWGTDEETGQDGPTLAGVLMFGKIDVIYRVMPQYIVDYREHIGVASGRWSHRIQSLDAQVTGKWSGNLFDFYRLVREQLRQGLPDPFQLVGGRRVHETIVEDALREALTNTIIHADYAIGRAILIERFPDRFEFVNPGELRIPVHQVYEGGRSDCRNRNLQRMFQMMGEGEQGGTGYPTMLGAWREKHWWPPVLVERREMPEVILTLKMQSLFSADVQAELESRFGPEVAELPREAKLALEATVLEGAVTNMRLRVLADVDSTVAAGVLRRLVAGGFLEKRGERQHSSYVLPAVAVADAKTPLAIPALSDSERRTDVPTSSDTAGELHTNGRSSAHLPAETTEAAADSAHLNREVRTFADEVHTFGDGEVHTFDHEVHTVEPVTAPRDDAKSPGDAVMAVAGELPQAKRSDLAAKIGIPEADLATLLALPKVHLVRNSGKAQTKVVEDAILDALKNRFLTAVQVGALLDRHPSGINERYLRPLARAGRLELLYPETVNHPAQAYRKKSE